MAALALYLLDTNTASFIIRAARRPLERLQAHPVSAIGISAVTEAEMLYGLARKPAATALAAAVTGFLDHVQVLPWDRAAAARYGALRAALEAGGMMLGNLDTLIAAHALAVGAVLVSNDRAFSRVSELRVEDWSAP